VRAAQIRLGDREVTVNAAGERVSRLREVDADWILRRLERWGRRVRAAAPRRRTEAGRMRPAGQAAHGLRWGAVPGRDSGAARKPSAATRGAPLGRSALRMTPSPAHAIG
jgi:hypothetical protein